MRFYLGTHQPAWLAQGLGVPLLVSHRRLAGRRSLPRASGPWACDSGGFSELSLYGRWRTDERSYVAALRRYATEIGQLDWAAPMDHMVESQVLARTGAEPCASTNTAPSPTICGCAISLPSCRSSRSFRDKASPTSTDVPTSTNDTMWISLRYHCSA